MTQFKSYLDNEIEFLQSGGFEGWLRLGGLPVNACPFRRHSNGGEFLTAGLLPVGYSVNISHVFLVNPTIPLECSYAEMFVTNASGTESLGVEADAGLTLTQGINGADWTGYSTFGAVGTDLVASGTSNAVITSTAGGLFFVRLALWTA